MNLKRLSAIIAFFVAADAVAAETYRAELTGNFQRLSPASHQAPNLDFSDISGEWYFESVDTQTHPLAEAAFLERASSISMTAKNTDTLTGVGYFDPETGFSTPDQQVDSRNSLIGEVSYYIPNTILHVGAMYQYSRIDVSGYGHFSSNDWGATLGVTPIAGLLILTEYQDEWGYDPNVKAQYVTKLGENNAMRLEASFYRFDDYSFDERDDFISAGGDFYFDRSWSIGTWMEHSFDTGFGLRSRKFFTDTFSVSGEYFELNSSHRYQISAALRF